MKRVLTIMLRASCNFYYFYSVFLFFNTYYFVIVFGFVHEMEKRKYTHDINTA